MKLKRASFFTALLLASVYCFSQNEPVGYWADYFSYHNGLTVCQGPGSTIYCCTSSGVFSLADNTVQRYSKVTGLSDIGCTVARYNSTTNSLVIGYSDGNIDVMTNNRVINIPDLKNSSVQGNRTINNIYFQNNIAYISCGQGLMVVDLNQDIILEVCYIGSLGRALNTYDATIFNNKIYAATDSGVYYVPENANISDFQNWQRIPSDSLPVGVYNGIVTCGNKLYASFSTLLTDTNSKSPYDTVFQYSGGKWSRDANVKNDNVHALESSMVKNAPCLIYCGNYSTNIYDTAGHQLAIIYNYGFQLTPAPHDAVYDNGDNLWIADANYGLVQCNSSGYGANYFPSGPYSNTIFAMASQGSTLYMVPGGYSDGNPEGFANIGAMEDYNNTWYRLMEHTIKDTIFDLCCVTIDPRNPAHAFAGSFNNGVVEYDTGAVVNLYNPSNTNNALQSLVQPGNFYSLRVGGVAFDSSDNLWVSVSNVNTCLVVKKSDGSWQSFNFAGISNFTSNPNATNLIVTKSGAKWISLPGTGILAYQDHGTFAAPDASNSVLINNVPGNGNLPSLNINCMVEDLNGAIWVGNDQQVVVFYSPDDVFNGPGGWDAQNVYVQQTGYTQYLMQGQFVSCIAIDGANRKWIGTGGGGAFLMSADGTRQILNFTSSNSPLPSDNIIAITINQATGEVFIATDQGLVSYRSDATGGGTAFGNVYAYPDPVQHGYTGPIIIKNLVANSDVKIATVSGEVVYHTVALGGQAVWYGTNFSGERVQTGVYLVFCTSPDGTQSIVTKLLLIN